MPLDWHQRDLKSIYPALENDLIAQNANFGERGPSSSRNSTASMFDAIEEDHVAAWVENHAALAWQQAPPEAGFTQGQSAASIEETSAMPAEASQLSQLGSDGNRRSVPRHRENPLEGHPRYRHVQDLSSGVDSFVHLAVDTVTGEQVAIKFAKRDRLDVHVVTREVVNQRACARHPHIVPLHEVFQLKRHLAIVMSYCNGGDLANLIGDRLDRGKKGLRENEARFCFQQIIMAIDYCHCLGISIRDIKVDNILLHWVPGAQRPILKLCDFSFSRQQSRSEPCSSACGTPEYMSPEVLFGGEYCGNAADVWAAGVSLYVLLTGGFPFTRPVDAGETAEKSMQAMFMRIVAGHYKAVPQLSQESQHLLHNMLRPSPQDRMELGHLLSHPWFLKDLPPQLRAVNANLFCGVAAVAADASFVDPCHQSEEELAEIIQHAAIAGEVNDDDLLAGAWTGFAAPSPENHSALQQQECALAQQQQREHDRHCKQRLAETEYQIAKERHRLAAREAAMAHNLRLQPTWPAAIAAEMQQRQKADSGLNSELAGDTGVQRLADALSHISCASGSNGAVMGTSWQPQSSAAASRRTSVAQQLPEERFLGGQPAHHRPQALTGESLASYRQQEAELSRVQQLAHLLSQSITADQLAMIAHHHRQQLPSRQTSNQRQRQAAGQATGQSRHRLGDCDAIRNGMQATLEPTSGGTSSAMGGRPVAPLNSPLLSCTPASRLSAPSFQLDFSDQHIASAQPSLQGDMSCDNKAFEFDQPKRSGFGGAGKYADSASEQSCHMR